MSGNSLFAEAGEIEAAPGPLKALSRGMRWQRVFCGRKSQVAAARHFVGFLLAGCPVRDDAELCVSELTSNACLHTASGDDGWFAVEVSRQPGLVIIAVADGGGPGQPVIRAHPDEDLSDGGYGLSLVDAISDRWGSEERPFGRLTWAEFTWGAAARIPALRSGPSLAGTPANRAESD